MQGWCKMSLFLLLASQSSTLVWGLTLLSVNLQALALKQYDAADTAVSQHAVQSCASAQSCQKWILSPLPSCKVCPSTKVSVSIATQLCAWICNRVNGYTCHAYMHAWWVTAMMSCTTQHMYAELFTFSPWASLADSQWRLFFFCNILSRCMQSPQLSQPCHSNEAGTSVSSRLELPMPDCKSQTYCHNPVTGH